MSLNFYEFLCNKILPIKKITNPDLATTDTSQQQEEELHSTDILMILDTINKVIDGLATNMDLISQKTSYLTRLKLWDAKIMFW